MERSRKRGLKKCDHYVEVNLTGEENYDLCVQKAVTSLGIEYETDDYTPCIVRLSGCKVLNQPVHIDGKELAWTISRYVRSVFQKSTHSVKLGIALLQVNKCYAIHAYMHAHYIIIVLMTSWCMCILIILYT